jgi:hypothetical protein
LQCERVNNNGSEGEKKDGFLKLTMMKVPYLADSSSPSTSEEKFRAQCLENCSCIAYAYDFGIGCMTWTGSLIDVQKFSTDGADLYVRLAYSELGVGKLFAYRLPTAYRTEPNRTTIDRLPTLTD